VAAAQEKNVGSARCEGVRRKQTFPAGIGKNAKVLEVRRERIIGKSPEG